jgi:hypothetical protein
MSQPRPTSLVLASCVVIALAAPVAAQAQAQGRAAGADDPAAPPSIEAINAAIDRGVDYLVKSQYPDGSWESNIVTQGAGGTEILDVAGGTALCVAALLHGGLDPGHQAVQRGVAFVRSRPLKLFYGTTTRLLMEHDLGDKKDVRAMEAAAEYLLGGARSSYWDYPEPAGKGDLSVTQYAVLGLWLAQLNKVKVPDKVFEQAARVILAEQLADGGWDYHPAPQADDPTKGVAIQPDRYATCSMTTAAVASLLFCKDALGKSAKEKMVDDIDAAVARGGDWLDLHMSYEGNVALGGEVAQARQWDYYYFYNIERLGFALATETLGGEPWYQTGAKSLVKAQLPTGCWPDQMGSSEPNPVSTAFALLFLERATTQVKRVVTGDRLSERTRELAGKDLQSAMLDVRVLPTKKTIAYVAGFNPKVRETYGREGVYAMRVESVTYYVDGQEVGKVTADVAKPSGTARYELELQMSRGKHVVEAVALIAPEPEKGQPVSSERVRLASAKLQIDFDWGFTAEDQRTVAELGQNLMLANAPSISVSSEHESPRFKGARACDGVMSMGWAAPPSDPQPWIRLSWDKPVKAQVIVLTPVMAAATDGGYFQKPKKVELSVNGKAQVVELTGAVREAITLDKMLPVKLIEIRVLETHVSERGKNGTGFAEIELLAKAAPAAKDAGAKDKAGGGK